MRILIFTINIVLIAYVVWEVVDFLPRYRQLKLDLAAGDAGARSRVYWRALAFEWISALLALGALEFDWNRFNPKLLDLGSMGLIQSLSRGGAFPMGMVAGVLGGIIAGTLGFVVARMKANRRGTPTPQDVPPQRWRKLLPDFFALLPVTIHERLLWAAVAISAGVCEEVVFRGWLAMLHGHADLSGTRLILVAAIVFGLAHVYQGITGVILTAFAGAFFCVLYIATGLLLVPILLHSLIDLRFALLPAPRFAKARASFA